MMDKFATFYQFSHDRINMGMVFKQSFKYLINGNINLNKVIPNLECLFYQNIYIYILFHHILYS